mgnify:FL=1
MEKLPLRPKNQKKYNLSDNEMNSLVWYTLSGCKREEAFMLFVRPDLSISRQNLVKATNQFFAMFDVRDFLNEYNKTLSDFYSNKEKPRESKQSREDRVGNAVKKFTDKVMDAMDDADSIEISEMDTLAKLADRVGILGKNEEVEEKPRRYLPETCSWCSYRKFVEDEMSQGNLDDECSHCKTRRFAESKGWVFDATKNIINDD